MDKGYCIFRDPLDKRIQGFWGNYHSVSGGFYPSDKKMVLIQPWDRYEKAFCLIPESHSTDWNEFQQWVNRCPLKSVHQLFESDEFEFAELIREIQYEIKSEDLEKAVAARSKAVKFDEANILYAFEQACMHYQTAFVYLLFHPHHGLWLGASPETLINVNGENAETMALAGTLRNGTDEWTGKELEEQSVTAKFIEEILLEDHCTFTRDELTTAHAGPLRHLMARYHFHPRRDQVEKLLKDLHPTPAVGGYPRENALKLIDKNENLDRELYTGWIGWTEGNVLRTWVNLRCARLYKENAILFAGCGVNAGSDPDQEWKETEAKMEVIGRCLTKSE